MRWWSAAINPSYNDAKWRSLSLPHDWSIESNFSSVFPATNQGGALPGGIGWYRKTFKANESWKGKRVLLDFEGIMLNGEVWVNGKKIGGTDYGYLGFETDIAPVIKYDADNVVAVRAATDGGVESDVLIWTP